VYFSESHPMLQRIIPSITESVDGTHVPKHVVLCSNPHLLETGLSIHVQNTIFHKTVFKTIKKKEGFFYCAISEMMKHRSDFEMGVLACRSHLFHTV
jgi:hypothetical protein